MGRFRIRMQITEDVRTQEFEYEASVLPVVGEVMSLPFEQKFRVVSVERDGDEVYVITAAPLEV